MPDDQSLSDELEQAIEAQKMEELNSQEQQEQAVENDPAHLRLLEALLFASAEPVSEAIMAERLPEGAPVDQLLVHLQAEYSTRGVNLMHVGNGWAFRTAAELGDKLKIT